MAEFLNQKQAKQEGKKNLIYSFLNLTNNFIVRGSTFVEFQIGSQQQQLQQASKLYNIKQSQTNTLKQFSLLTYLVLWSEDTIQIYQILGNSEQDTKVLDTCLISSTQLNGRIQQITTFRRENNVYLICLLEKRKMITLMIDRQLNCLSCASQHSFNSQKVFDLNQNCLQSELDDDSPPGNNFQCEVDSQSNGIYSSNELVAVLISKKILALCFSASASKSVALQQSLLQQQAMLQIPQQPIPHPPQDFSSMPHLQGFSELKQSKQLFSPQTFYLDLQKKYEANNVIDFAVVCPQQTKVPVIFILNKKLTHSKEQSKTNPAQLLINQENGVFEVTKEITTELIIIQADLNKITLSQSLTIPSSDPQQNLQQQPQFNFKFDHTQKHTEFTKLPSSTYLVQGFENNLVLIMSNFYLFAGYLVNGIFSFQCLAFNHQQYKQDQLIMKELFSGPIVQNEFNIDAEEGLESVIFQQLDRNRILMKSPKKIYMLDILFPEQSGYLPILKISFVHNFSLHGQTFSARCCLDYNHNEFDLIFLNSRYSDNPYNSNLFILSQIDDQIEKRIKTGEENNNQYLFPQYKLRSQEKFENWSTIKDITFVDKDRPQWQNYYFTTGEYPNKKNNLYKCERMIRPQCVTMENYFRTESWTERVFEIEDTFLIVSCKNNKTLFFEKKKTLIFIYPQSHLFISNEETIAVVKDYLIEENSVRPVYVQMTPSKVRIVDVEREQVWDLQAPQSNLYSEQKSNQTSRLIKLAYVCNTVIVVNEEKSLFSFTFIQQRWIEGNYIENNIQDRCVVGVQRLQPYFSISERGIDESNFLFIGFPNEFQIFSAQFSQSGVIFKKVFETSHVKEGLAFLSNGLLYSNKEVLKENLLRSITDPSIKLEYESRETNSSYVVEYSLLSLQKSLVLLVRLNSGDLYIYKGILKINSELFQYEFIRQPIRSIQFINIKPSQQQNEQDILKQNNSLTEKAMYSFLKLQTTIFKNTSIDCIIVTDIGRPGACLTIFENNVQEIFLHLMLLPISSSTIPSLASQSLYDEQNKLVAKGFLIPVDGKIYLFQLSMNLKYNSQFLHESPPSLSIYNPLFIEIVRVAKIKTEEGQPETYKKYIVIVNSLGVKQEIILVDEENPSEAKKIKVLPENEKVYKFKTFEGTNKKDMRRYKIQLVGYLTQSISNQGNSGEEEIDTKFYCHYIQNDPIDPMPEMTNGATYKDFIFDFCFLNFPRTSDSNSSDHFKVVLMERDKVMTLNFLKNQITQGLDDGPYHQRLIISSIWNNKQYFLAGDVQKGVQLFEMDEKTSKPRLIGEENININVRQCVLFSLQNKNTLRALITDEARNLYAYSFTQQASSQEQGDQTQVLNEKRKISMELVASFHLGSKINKVTTDSRSSDNSLYDAVSHLILHRQDGNISIVQLIYEPGENTLLFGLQKAIFELPYLGGLDPGEFRELKLAFPSFKLKNSHSFFETAIVDTYFNMTRPLQEIIAKKLHRSREDFIKKIIETILS